MQNISVLHKVDMLAMSARHGRSFCVLLVEILYYKLALIYTIMGGVRGVVGHIIDLGYLSS